jgi:dihydrodipicolinate synthase/N-acetylneuraminate lyase
VVYNIPVFANEISLPVLERLAMDCPRIVGTKDTSKDMGRSHECGGNRAGRAQKNPSPLT